MTLTDCQLLSIVAQLGTFAAAAERLHITPSAVSHAVSGVEAECGFPLFTRTKSGVTLTAAAENLMPAIQQMLASSESLEQSIAQINGMHKGALRLGVFNSACVTWLPKIVPGFRAAFPGIDVQMMWRTRRAISGASWVFPWPWGTSTATVWTIWRCCPTVTGCPMTRPRSTTTVRWSRSSTVQRGIPAAPS